MVDEGVGTSLYHFVKIRIIIENALELPFFQPCSNGEIFDALRGFLTLPQASRDSHRGMFVKQWQPERVIDSNMREIDGYILLQIACNGR